MPETLSVQCCIAGGGPAGMMLGLLLARAGVSVLVLEKQHDQRVLRRCRLFDRPRTDQRALLTSVAGRQWIMRTPTASAGPVNLCSVPRDERE